MWREYLRVALRALRAHRLRSLLTVSSITLGAFSIVFMSSLAQSGLTTLARDLEELGGARIIMIAPKKPERAASRDGMSTGALTERAREHLFAALPHTTARAVYATLGSQDATSDGGQAARTDLVATDAGFFDLFGLRVEKGRTFTAEEGRMHARVCVVAYGLARALLDGDAVGRWMTIGGERCQIIGQLAKIRPRHVRLLPQRRASVKRETGPVAPDLDLETILPAGGREDDPRIGRTLSDRRRSLILRDAAHHPGWLDPILGVLLAAVAELDAVVRLIAVGTLCRA